jgi:hypothetical protein
MSQLLIGGLPELQTYQPLKNRTILKIHNATSLLDWCAQRFGVFTIYLVRHPIPQALSVLRNNWTITANAYLSDPVFSGKYLSPQQQNTGRVTMEKGTPLEKAVLNWVLESIYALKYAARVDLTLTYEELVLYPTQTINLLAQTVGLMNVSEMLERVNTPSRTRQLSDSETNEAIKRDNKEYLVGKWVSKVDKAARDRIGDILNTFEITEYNSDGFMPCERLCHFANFTSANYK